MSHILTPEIAEDAKTSAVQKEAYICLDDINASAEVRKKIRNLIAEDTLVYVNKNSVPVQPRKSFYSKYGKRMLDILISGCALLVTAPINLLICVCTYFDVGRPLIFRQVRVGQNEKPFEIIKFRNMTNATDEKGELLPPSQRVTKFGAFVRRTSLDELLNFWSVFKGDMSLIGPRPLVAEYQPYLSDRHRMRNTVKPGLECPMIKPLDHKTSWVEQFENDVFYVENISFLLDLKMIFALVHMVFDKKSRAIRGGATRGSFMGYHNDGSSINSKSVPEHYVQRAMKPEE